MKINDITVLITKVEPRKNKEGADYIALSFLDLGSGDNFDIVSKDIELIKLKPMTKYKVNLNLSNSKYGMRLEFDNVNEEIGGI